MSKREDFESRLRAYLTEAKKSPSPDLEERIRARAFGQRFGWAAQLLAAAAVLVLALGLGFAARQARLLGVAGSATPRPVVTPSASVTPSIKPTASPEASASPYPLLPPASMHMVSSNTGWAAGSGTNRILRTSDGGSHWEDVTPHAASAGTWITVFLDANNAWVASSLQPGSGSPDSSVAIYRTADGGRTWQQVSQVVADRGWPAALDFVDSKHGWLFMRLGAAAGAEGVAFYGTQDGGATWTKLSETDQSLTSSGPGTLPLGCSKVAPVFLNPSTGWQPGACNGGSAPYLYVTRDGGRNWAAVSLRIPQGTFNCDCSIESLRFWDQEHGAFVLENAYQDAGGYAQNFLYTTSDGGRSWQLGPLLPKNSFSVYFLDATHGWTLDAKTNTLLFSADAGQHWSTAGVIPTNSNGVVRDFQFVTPQIGWVLGADPRGLPILKTVDGGQTWTTQLAP